MMRSRFALLVAIAGFAALLASGASSAAPAPTVPTVESPAPTGVHIEWARGSAVSQKPFQGAAPDLTVTPDGNSACNVLMGTPAKSGTTIYEDASVSCTVDVTFISGTDYLYRGLGPVYVVNSQAKKANTNYLAWEPHGTCASSTWAYWAEIPDLETCSSVNGCIYAAPYDSNYHYWSC